MGPPFPLLWEEVAIPLCSSPPPNTHLPVRPFICTCIPSFRKPARSPLAGQGLRSVHTRFAPVLIEFLAQLLWRVLGLLLYKWGN